MESGYLPELYANCTMEFRLTVISSNNFQVYRSQWQVMVYIYLPLSKINFPSIFFLFYKLLFTPTFFIFIFLSSIFYFNSLYSQFSSLTFYLFNFLLRLTFFSVFFFNYLSSSIFYFFNFILQLSIFSVFFFNSLYSQFSSSTFYLFSFLL